MKKLILTAALGSGRDLEAAKGVSMRSHPICRIALRGIACAFLSVTATLTATSALASDGHPKSLGHGDSLPFLFEGACRHGGDRTEKGWRIWVANTNDTLTKVMITPTVGVKSVRQILPREKEFPQLIKTKLEPGARAEFAIEREEKTPPYFRPDDWPNGKGMRYDAGRRLFEIGISWRGKGLQVADNVRALEEGVVPAEAMENVLRYVELNGVDTSKYRKNLPRPPEKLGPPLKSVPGHSFGAMLDISRDKVPKMATLRWFVDVLAKLGYNEFQLYTENTFAYSRHAAACAETSPMTAAEIRELDDYCYARGIVLVPNQNSFGHMERWLAHREYLQFAEKTNGLYTVLGLPSLENRPAAAICPTDPKALEFIDGLYGELLPNFRHAKVLNVGCDETWDIFDREGRSAAAVRERGFDGVYIDHLNNLAGLARKRGFRISYWADMIIFYPDRVAARLPKDAVALMWGYGDEEHTPGLTAEYEGRVQMLQAAGAEVTVCPSTRTFGGWITDPDRVRGNTEIMSYVARKYGLKGYLMTIWGDGGQRAPYLSEVVGLAVASLVVRGEKADDVNLANEIDRVLGCRVGAALVAIGKLDAFRRGCRTAAEKATAAAEMRRILSTVDRASLVGPVANGIDTLALAADKFDMEARGAEFGERGTLASRYRELWLRDYRPGGLDHSVKTVFNLPSVASVAVDATHSGTTPTIHSAVAVQHLPSTMKIQQAIDAAWRAGGGRVVVPAGVHRIAGLRLRSNVELHLAAHAVLSASRNCDDFDILAGDKLEPIAPQLIAEVQKKRANGATNPAVRWNNAIIRLVGATNVVISGETGCAIDGNNSYNPNGEEQYRGVHGISCFYSSNVVVRGVELRHTGNWATRFAYSDDLLFEGLTILGGHDGVHARGCNRIRVRDCTILTGDDSIAGFGNDGLTVSNCTLSSSANMLRLGGRNILVEDCVARGPCPYPFRGWLTDEQKRLGTGAVSDLPHGRYTAAVFFTYFCDWTQPVSAAPENIVVRRCRVENVHRFLRYNFGGETWQHQWPIPEITFENCTAKGLLLPSIANARGEGEKIVMPFTLRLSDSSFAFLRPVESFVECQNVDCLDFKNICVHGVDGDIPAAASWMGTPKLSFEGVTGLKPEVVPRHGKYKWVFRCDEDEVRALYGNRGNDGDVKKALGEAKTVPQIDWR